MIVRRPAGERGRFDHGWLDTRHTFSFAQYHDPDHMGFRTLRVINEDVVQPGEGFGTHPHRDMEIVTYIVDGALEHRDSTGTGSVIRRGDVQRMTAGSGVLHSEFNHSTAEPVHFLQIWVIPRERNLQPEYEEKRFPDAEKRDRLRVIASPDGREGSLIIHQDATIHATILGAGKTLRHRAAPDRHQWVQVVSGSFLLNGEILEAGDGAAVTGETDLSLEARSDGELLLFDLA